ncbi:hypothetical protein ACFQRD_10310 [Brachybacterium sp. GCM10030268]|uniref:hypothetical protein n=1 Tax=Brachybacterium sp. GCM10030268 TaxID=3273382 RepID=UPI003607C114
MTNQTASSAPVRTSRGPLGLSILAILGLALLGVPLVILHDLGVLHPGTLANMLLVFVPVIVWIVVAIAARVPRPFLTLLAIGACYGVLLAIGHQIFWGASFPDGGPSLGGNLSDLDPTAQAIVFRLVAVISSLFTGVIVGVLSGLVAELVRLILRGVRRAA